MRFVGFKLRWAFFLLEIAEWRAMPTRKWRFLVKHPTARATLWYDVKNFILPPVLLFILIGVYL